MLEKILNFSVGKNLKVSFRGEKGIVKGRLVHSKTRGYMLKSPPESWGFAQRILYEGDINFLLLDYTDISLEAQQARTFKRFQDREGSFTRGAHYIDGFPLVCTPEEVVFADPALSFNFDDIDTDSEDALNQVYGIAERDIHSVGRLAWIASDIAELGFNIPLRRRIDEFFLHELAARDRFSSIERPYNTELDRDRNHKLCLVQRFISSAKGTKNHGSLRSAIMLYNAAVLYESVGACDNAIAYYEEAKRLITDSFLDYRSLYEYMVLRIDFLQEERHPACGKKGGQLLDYNRWKRRRR